MSNTEKKLFLITTNDNELYFVARTINNDYQNGILRAIGAMFEDYVYGVIKQDKIYGATTSSDGVIYIEADYLSKYIDSCIQKCLESTLTLSSSNIKTVQLFCIEEEE